MSRISRFFERYEQGANSFDPDVVCPQYTAEFLAAGPWGVACGRNDDALRQAMVQRKALFEQIGFRRARVLGVDETPLDQRYTLARVQWRMTFEQQPGCPVDVEFAITYVLFDDDSGPKAAFWITHEDETDAMRRAGLQWPALSATSPPTW